MSSAPRSSSTGGSHGALPDTGATSPLAALVDAFVRGASDAEARLAAFCASRPVAELKGLFAPAQAAAAAALQEQAAAARDAHAAAQARVKIEQNAVRQEILESIAAAKKRHQDALTSIPLPHRPGWDEAVWEAYDAAAMQQSETLPATVCAGSIQLAGSPGAVSPHHVPFVGRGRNLVFHSDTRSRDAALGTLQSIVWRIATLLPNQVQFLFIDPHNSGNAFHWANRLPGRIENTDLIRDLESAERTFTRIARNYLSGSITSFEQIPQQQRRREKLQLVVVADFPRGFQSDSRALEVLRRIAVNGMKGGTYVLLHWDNSAEPPRNFDITDRGIGAFPGAFYVLNQPTAAKDRGWDWSWDPAPPVALQSLLLSRLGKAQVIRTELSFRDLIGLPRDQWWTASAAERLVTPIGTRGSDDDTLRLLLGETEDGQPCVHGVIGAGTGMGKSNLFHVAVLGLAMRYSPDELRFYLVDGKDGVEFRAYHALPHAAVLSLNTAPQLARSLLADLAQEMERRNGLFRRLKISSYKDYSALRRSRTDLPPLPRLLLVVDEYQELFDGDRDGEASRHLALLTAQGRSAGLHLLLASQRFGASGMQQRDAIFSQIQLRIAMKIAQSDVAGLTEFQRDGKEAINALDGPGKVVVNDRSGQDGFNLSGIISYVKAAERDALVAELAEAWSARSAAPSRPIVFEGRAQPRLRDNPRLATLLARPTPPTPSDLEQFARRPALEGGVGIPEWHQAEDPRIAWVGQELNVRGFAHLVVRRQAADNLLLVGANPNARHGMLLALLTSFAANAAPARHHFHLVDRTLRGSPWEKILTTWVETIAQPAGIPARLVTDTSAIVEQLSHLAAELDRRLALADEARLAAPAHFVVLVEPERIDALQRKDDGYGGRTESPAGAHLRRLFTEGPTAGLHVIVSCASGRALGGLLDLRRGLAHFRFRLLLQMSEDESFDLTASRRAAKLQADGDQPVNALLFNVDASAPLAFKPHIATATSDDDSENPGLLAELPALRSTFQRWGTSA